MFPFRDAAPDRLDAVLGPSAQRYFGSRYRDVEHRLREIGPVQGDDELSMRASAAVRYPDGWSAGRASTEPHLSSIDAVILPLKLLEASAPTGRLGRRFVTSLTIRSGSTPWTRLDTVPVTMALARAREPWRFGGVVGGIRVDYLLAADEHRPAPHPGGASVYGVRSLGTNCRTTQLALDRAASSLAATHSASAGDLGPASGVEASWWPAMTVIDAIAIMGQLTQALVYGLRNLHRSGAGPLWMRAITMRLVTPPATLPLHFDTTTQLVRDRQVPRDTTGLRDARVRCTSSVGVVADADLAYREHH